MKRNSRQHLRPGSYRRASLLSFLLLPLLACWNSACSSPPSDDDSPVEETPPVTEPPIEETPPATEPAASQPGDTPTPTPPDEPTPTLPPETSPLDGCEDLALPTGDLTQPVDGAVLSGPLLVEGTLRDDCGLELAGFEIWYSSRLEAETSEPVRGTRATISEAFDLLSFDAGPGDYVIKLWACDLTEECRTVDSIGVVLEDDEPGCEDLDQDGAGEGDCPLGPDCDDSNPDIRPGTTELCGDSIDNDCDPSTLEKQGNWYADADGDGYPDERVSTQDCSPPEGYIAKRTDGKWDCDDSNPAINPGATEICDEGTDNDCNTATLEKPGTWYPDFDTDSYPAQSGSVLACSQPDGHIVKRSDSKWDCDDTDPEVNPASLEVCDGKDNDCSTSTVEKPGTWYPDSDGDGYPAQSGSVQECVQPDGHVVKRSDSKWDCDDTDPEVNPASLEVCDGKDNDCSTSTVEKPGTWYPDSDGDGYPAQSGSVQECEQPEGYIVKRSDSKWDCDDSQPSVYPGAEEVCDNGVDEDCDDHEDDGCYLLSDECSDYTGSSGRYTCGGGLVLKICGVLDADGYMKVTVRKLDGSSLGTGKYRVKVFSPSTSNSQACDTINTTKSEHNLTSSTSSFTFSAFDSQLDAAPGTTKSYCVGKEDAGDHTYWCSAEMTATYNQKY